MGISKKVILVAAIGLISLSGYALVQADKNGLNLLSWARMPVSSKYYKQDDSAKISITLTEKISGLKQITDFQAVPGQDQFVILQKNGEAYLSGDLYNSKRGTKSTLLFKIKVLTDSEQGLLGIAFHPQYPAIPCAYLNYVVSSDGDDTSEVAEWCHKGKSITSVWSKNRLLISVKQPYKNHNAGHLVFDDKGRLYIPWGDGGSSKDPHGYAQNMQSFLGKMLRIKPSALDNKTPYMIPKDNPFVNDPDIPDEIYAYGLRNPWKISFDNSGRLIAADVGQYEWEEVTFVEAGKNHGWNDIEGLHCFKPKCSAANTVLPFIEYGHSVGSSITGGYQYLGKEIPPLTNKYIYGDFVTGQLWAADLPEQAPERPSTRYSLNQTNSAQTYTQVYSLGQWPLLISSFGRDHEGNVYVADFARGKIFKIEGTNN